MNKNFNDGRGKMKQIIISFIFITIFILSSHAFAFSDTQDHWAEDTISRFQEYNIIKGYQDGSFQPNQYLTRAEVATIINRLIGATKESYRYVPDITRQDWYYSEIRKSLQSGVMLGDDNGYVYPERYITREEAVVMIGRAFCVETQRDIFVPYTDANEISKWSKDYFNTFINIGYINGYQDGTVHPKGNITRAEFITILDRMFENIVVKGIYTGSISGSMLIIGKGVTIKDAIINGSLYIAEGTKETLTLKNVEVKEDFVVRENISNLSEVLVEKNRYLLYSDDDVLEKYYNTDYGIEFSISPEVKVIEKTSQVPIDYEEENLLILGIEQNNDYLLKSIDSIGNKIVREFDNIYTFSEKGTIGKHSLYILYDDLSKGANHKCLIIKRDNTVYTLFFNKITVKNLFDNVVATIKLTPGASIIDREDVIYKNAKLNLKFTYREGYVGVDDSYNTGEIYSGDAPLRLFIQVNTITDMSNYTNVQIKSLLQSLAEKEGTLLESESLEIINNPAFKFKIKADDKEKYLVYITVGNSLYHLIFTATEEDMSEVGEDFFNEIINSLER